MQEPLWTFEDLVAASGGKSDGECSVEITGVSIDTRTLMGGEVFVALKDQRDGHEFVTAAFEKGAAAAVVSKDYKRAAGDGALVRVKDPLEALGKLAIAARARLSSEARVIAVTGSAGKTSTKEMLRLALLQVGATHASEKSYNNHWGVPLTLARMPATTEFAVFEIGMNHPGEIRPLSKMVRPHVAIVTTVAPVHLAYFKNVEEIARAKAEIIEGLEPSGCAVLNRDNDHFDLLSSIAGEAGFDVLGFGKNSDASSRIVEVKSTFEGSQVRAIIEGEDISYRITAPGEHLQINSVAVLAACKRVGADLARSAVGLSEFEVPEGRGERLYITCEGGQTLVIDETYNANPASVRAALGVLSLLGEGVASRKIAVLGDMLELGDDSERLHRELRAPLVESGIDLVFACGPNMAHLMEDLPSKMRGGYAKTSDELERIVLDGVGAGDVIVVKGSLGSRMGGIVRSLKIGLSSRTAKKA